MNAPRLALMLFVGAAVTGALGYASRAPFTPRDSEKAVSRLSWRLRGEKIESCRDRTAAELEALPAHMRTPRECTSQLVAYKLSVTLDGQRTQTNTFTPAGAKGDRPVFVLHDIQLPPGEHRVDVAFAPIVATSDAKTLRYSGTVSIARGDIALITMEPQTHTLVLRK